MGAFKAIADRDILGIRVKSLGWTEALDELERGLAGDEPQRIVNFLNANNANMAMRDPTYRSGLSRSQVLPDGIGIDIASRALHGRPFPANLNGTDLVPALLVRVSRPLRVALVGARPDVLARATANFSVLMPWHHFTAVSDGYFDRAESARVLERLAELAPDITLVAMGSPAQEIWIDGHIGAGHGRLVVGVGALFDFISGGVPRAPDLVREMRLEWLYRLSREPGRLWRRYVLGNPLFLFHVLRYKLGGHVSSSSPAS
ncbi:exopolysaccharide biosynthesis WecB/TagA/CpsF family protein [Hoeflea marina]|uniref:Exopolysaccharide biosynthesis WecB/TagA/CpsF family protein n=1 Tax=Hoeflea marina TaxID=274592 RepID=A0A317PD49_9HYPH|nr:WecB/TagA/CpsF family glycosyltransferase [Hoeflea marina]PWV95264.1 exopolysaccharide biosynthesis WecB/TagA/CpsF family protein [Hoeflea marina]